jgi:hypothetical protein
MSEPLLVRSLALESDGVLAVELVDPQGRELPAWEPGAHVDLPRGRHARLLLWPRAAAASGGGADVRVAGGQSARGAVRRTRAAAARPRG